MVVGYVGFALFVVGAMLVAVGLLSHYACGVDYGRSARVAGTGGRVIQVAFACLLATAFVSIAKSQMVLDAGQEFALSLFFLVVGCFFVFVSRGRIDVGPSHSKD